MSHRRRCRGARWGLAGLLALVSSWPLAAEALEADDTTVESEPESELDLRAYRKLTRPRTRYARTFGTVAMGRGLRFNNPYRLSTQLGEDAESLSLTATYLDLSVNLGFGPPDGLQHGASLHYTTSVEGVGQQVVTPSYIAMIRGDRPTLVYGRLGLPILVTPDLNMGGELAAGLAWFFTGALGVTGELVFDLFYGAATHEVDVTAIPVLSLQLGMILDYEILP